jgi:hypothetical protein
MRSYRSTSPGKDFLSRLTISTPLTKSGLVECGIGVLCVCFPFMPMLWKSILHKNRPSYSSNYSKSQFEMMNSSNKRSRHIVQNPPSVHFNGDLGSDENILITNGKSYVTTKLCAGDDATLVSNASAENSGFGASLDDSYILRTVEVRHTYDER